MTTRDKIIIGRLRVDEIVPPIARPLVFTNGVFDVLHRGHVTYLETARAVGASLIVGLNTDASVRLLGKGSDRPLNAEGDRAVVLAALACISAVMLFDEQTPLSLIRRLRPDVYVKGGDYVIDDLEEAALVRSWGGTALTIPFVEGFSTTDLIRRIRASS